MVAMEAMHVSSPLAVTVDGTYSSDELGFVLPHEHLLFALTSRHKPPDSVDLQSLRDAPITLSRLAQAAYSNRTVVTSNLCLSCSSPTAIV